ncbi:uncharacterized protein LOC143085196 [Mytilus galloprovincialis]|uniref:uncharacterized protein LOC143085196 n=1 Tax=Mytilus galloprovincialis TaxID=29158 RepID=UPI003F7B74E8
MSDWIPLVAQVKSIVQISAGDEEGAKQTQETFAKRCPIVSQTVSVYQAFNGDMVGAKETQMEFLGMINDTVNSIPIVGHAKGMVHYVAGDKMGGDEAMKSASHTTGTIGGGIAGFGLLGPIGAIAGGITGGAIMDATITTADTLIHDEDRPYGYFNQIKQIKEKPGDAGQWVDIATSLALDGLAGHTAGVAYNQQTTKETAKAKKNKNKVKSKKNKKPSPIKPKGKTENNNRNTDYKILKQSDSKSKMSNAQCAKSNAQSTVVLSEPNGNQETHTPQPSYSVTSAIADFTESTTDAAATMGKVIVASKGIMDNSSAGEFLINTLQGSSSARLRNKTSESKEIEALERSKSFPIPKEGRVMKISQLLRGDHIKYKRLFGYSHHAIVTNVFPESNEYEIVHFQPPSSGNKINDSPLIRQEIKQLDEAFYVLEYEDRYPHEATATMAEVMIGYNEEDRITIYSVFSNNCEHLATYCVTGQAYSTQVGNGKELVKALVKTGMIAASKSVKRQRENIEAG